MHRHRTPSGIRDEDGAIHDRPFFAAILAGLCLSAPTSAQTTPQEVWRDTFDMHVVSAKMDASGTTVFAGYDSWEGDGFAVKLDPAGSRGVQGTWWHVGDAEFDAAGNADTIYCGDTYPGGRVYVQKYGVGGWIIEIAHPVDIPAGEYQNDWPLELALAPDGPLVAAVAIETCTTSGCQGTSRGFVAKYDPANGAELWHQVSTVGVPRAT